MPLAESTNRPTPPKQDAPGQLEAIWIKRMRLGPMDPQQRVKTIAGRGLEGNANQGGKRQVTVLDAERWERVCKELGAEIDPRLRRANLLIRGIDLQECRGRILRVGSCRIQLLGETRPCRKMEESHPGLQHALDPEWRGGAYGTILDDGEISVSDSVSLE